MVSRRSHPAQHGEAFDWSANLRAQQFWAPEGGYILSSLREDEERLWEKGGAFFNINEGRDDFRKNISLRRRRVK